MAKELPSHSSFFQRHAVVSFCILALALGTGAIYLVVKGVLPSGLALASALSASLAGIIITAVADGKSGLKWMFRRLLIWRVGMGYWLFACLFIVPVFLLGSLFNPPFHGDPLDFRSLTPAFEILPLFIVFLIASGLGQELGWTGFFIPRLQARFSALTSSVIRALFGAIWHLPLLLYSRQQLPELASFPYGSWIAQRGFLVAMLVMILMFLIPWSIFFTWLFNNTKGSLLVVVVFHASEFWLAFWMMSAGINQDNLDNYWGYGAVMVITAVMLVITTGPQNLSRTQQRVVYYPLPG